MFGLMQQQPLLLSSIITHAARHHGGGEIVSKLTDGSLHRSTYAEIEQRARRLARVLQAIGVQPGDRVATLAWNGYRHLELFYAICGLGAVCHTVNPRLAPDDVALIMHDAEDCVLFADTDFIGLVSGLVPRVPSLRAVVMMCGDEQVPDLSLPAGVTLASYEALMGKAEADYAWPSFDENMASVLCYTSGTTGGQRAYSTVIGPRCCTHTRRTWRTSSACARRTEYWRPRRCTMPRDGLCPTVRQWSARLSSCLAATWTAPAWCRC